jgi:AraC-like DNA-binding protein/flagellar biosynthesis protein FliQ
MEHLKLILLVASFLFPLTLSIVLVLDLRDNNSRKLMVFLLFNSSFLFICNYLYFQQDYTLYLPIHGLHSGLELWIFPVVFLYMKSITQPHFEIKKELLHFLPGLLMIVLASYIFYIWVGTKDLAFFLKYNRTGFHFVGYSFHVLTVSRYVHLSIVALQGIIYSILFYITPTHYNERLRNEFSNIENFSIDWINHYNLTFVGLVLFGFVLYAFVPLEGYKELLIVFTFFLFSAFVCLLGLISLKQQKVEIDLDEIDINYSETPAETKIKDDVLLKKLIDYVQNKQAFLQPDISLSRLCRELGTNRTYLSALINQQFGSNFNSFINEYRVNYIKDYLKKYPETAHNELFQIGGFGSVSSMKRALGKK